MAIIAKQIVALRAFIEELQAQIITLKNGGLIQSENFQQGQSGFRIRHNGDAEFNDAVFRGHIEAESGTIKEQALFLGTINSGPVFISNENTSPVPPQIFNANTTIRDIASSIGYSGTFNINGSYGNRTDLISIITARPQNNLMQTLHLIFNSGNDVFIEDTISGTYPNITVNFGRISQQLSIGGSVSGKIFRISNLPTGGAGLPPGTLYRIGNQLMIAT